MASRASAAVNSDSSNNLDNDKPPKSQRDFEKCHFCRRDHKKCELPDHPAPQGRCLRCCEKSWPCSARVRAPTTQITPDMFTQEFLVIHAAQLLLSSSRYDTQRIRGLVYPWPGAGLFQYCPETSWHPNSSSLREDFDHLASWWDCQMEASDRMERRLLSLQRSVLTNGIRHGRHLVGGASAVSNCIAGISPERRNDPAARRGNGSTTVPSSSPGNYLWLAGAVGFLLQSQFADMKDQLGSGQLALLDIERAFPAAHIAYLNGDVDVAVDLWWQASGQSLSKHPHAACPDQYVDMLGRTFLQLVAESGDYKTLRKVHQLAGTSVLRVNPDGRKLSLFALAVCAPGKPDMEYISMLLSQRRWSISGQRAGEPSIVDLALLSSNILVVQMLVDRNIITESYSRYVQKAIELCRADMALCFVPWLSEEVRISPHEVLDLARLARTMETDLQKMHDNAKATDLTLALNIRLRQARFPELVKRIDNTVVQIATVDQTMMDLDQISVF